MISWHRVGQKMTPIDGVRWIGDRTAPDPVSGTIYTIREVRIGKTVSGVVFILEGLDGFAYAAKDFRPAYPDIIDQLRNLDAPVPSEPVRVKEGV